MENGICYTSYGGTNGGGGGYYGGGGTSVGNCGGGGGGGGSSWTGTLANPTFRQVSKQKRALLIITKSKLYCPNNRRCFLSYLTGCHQCCR
ncbi:MAG: hypothetical protein IPH94_19015 [Saprospiraceae bacterium]|nr:hypothetical protein [Saprospiraceae bacterium]